MEQSAAKPDPAQSSEALPPHLRAVQAVYCNGFELGIGTSDVFIVVAQNGRRMMMLNLSYTTAKTLAKGILDSIRELEEKSGHEIMTVPEVSGFLLGKEEPVK